MKGDVENKLEKCRKDYFYKYPSRLNCLFVCPSAQSIYYWLKELYSSQNFKKIYVYRIEITGDLLIRDGSMINHLVDLSANKVQFQKEICDYWKSSEMHEESPNTQEGLFKGVFKIIEEHTEKL